MIDAGKDAGGAVGHHDQHADDYDDADYVLAQQTAAPVVVAKLDCVAHPDVCRQQEFIRAYPTLRLFVDGKAFARGASDYQGHRTISEMITWLQYMEEQYSNMLKDDDNDGNENGDDNSDSAQREKARKLHAAHEGTTTPAAAQTKNAAIRDLCVPFFEHTHRVQYTPSFPLSLSLSLFVGTNIHNNPESRRRLNDGSDENSDEAEAWRAHQTNQKRRTYMEWKDADHPGCQLSGHLLLDRAPGNFHILARSKSHDLAPHLTNVSHMVHSLSIGDPMAGVKVVNGDATVPPEVKSKMYPLDGNVYATYNLHEAYHHYFKVVPTKAPGLQVGRRDLKAYQIIPSSQLAYYTSDMVPEVRLLTACVCVRVCVRSTERRLDLRLDVFWVSAFGCRRLGVGVYLVFVFFVLLIA